MTIVVEHLPERKDWVSGYWVLPCVIREYRPDYSTRRTFRSRKVAVVGDFGELVVVAGRARAVGEALDCGG